MLRLRLRFAACRPEDQHATAAAVPDFLSVLPSGYGYALLRRDCTRSMRTDARVAASLAKMLAAAASSIARLHSKDCDCFRHAASHARPAKMQMMRPEAD